MKTKRSWRVVVFVFLAGCTGVTYGQFYPLPKAPPTLYNPDGTMNIGGFFRTETQRIQDLYYIAARPPWSHLEAVALELHIGDKSREERIFKFRDNGEITGEIVGGILGGAPGLLCARGGVLPGLICGGVGGYFGSKYGKRWGGRTGVKLEGALAQAEVLAQRLGVNKKEGVVFIFSNPERGGHEQMRRWSVPSDPMVVGGSQ